MRAIPFIACCFVSSCGPGLFPAPDAGLIDVGDPPPGFDWTATTEGCSTRQKWTRGDSESSLMHPGRDCIDCHRREGPRYTIAGTVLQRLDDGDDCRGIPDATVEILTGEGAVALTLTTNAAGNFASRASLADIEPWTARVLYDGRAIEMTTPQTDGACNRCHTADGEDGAPGRVLVP